MSEGAVRSAGPSSGTTVAAPGPVGTGPVGTGPAAGAAESRGLATSGGAAAAVTVTATATVTVPVPPPGFAAAQPGDVLAATVLGRAGEPRVVLNTHLGQLTLPAPQTLPVGATVQVVIVATEPALQVQVQPAVGADGRPAPAQPPAPGGPAGSAAAPSPEIGLRVGLVLAGRFVPSPPQPPGPATTIVPGPTTPAAATGPTIDRGAGTIFRQAAAPGRAAPVLAPATPGGASGGAPNGATPPLPARPAPAPIAAPAMGAAAAKAGALSVCVLAIATPGQQPLPTPGQALAGTVVFGAPPGQSSAPKSSTPCDASSSPCPMPALTKTSSSRPTPPWRPHNRNSPPQQGKGGNAAAAMTPACPKPTKNQSYAEPVQLSRPEYPSQSPTHHADTQISPITLKSSASKTPREKSGSMMMWPPWW